MGIQRYVFFSIHNCDRHQHVPLMRIKSTTEQFLQQSGLKYTTLRLCGFMQVKPPLQYPQCTGQFSSAHKTILRVALLLRGVGARSLIAGNDTARFTLLQALIGNYAVPILDDKQVWGTSDETRTAYLDSLVSHSIDSLALVKSYF